MLFVVSVGRGFLFRIPEPKAHRRAYSIYTDALAYGVPAGSKDHF